MKINLNNQLEEKIEVSQSISPLNNVYGFRELKSDKDMATELAIDRFNKCVSKIVDRDNVTTFLAKITKEYDHYNNEFGSNEPVKVFNVRKSELYLSDIEIKREYIQVKEFNTGMSIMIPRFFYKGIPGEFDPNKISPGEKDGVLWFVFGKKYTLSYTIDKYDKNKSGTVIEYDLQDPNSPFNIKNIAIEKDFSPDTPYSNMKKLIELANQGIDAVMGPYRDDFILIGHLKGKTIEQVKQTGPAPVHSSKEGQSVQDYISELIKLKQTTYKNVGTIVGHFSNKAVIINDSSTLEETLKDLLKDSD